MSKRRKKQPRGDLGRSLKKVRRPVPGAKGAATKRHVPASKRPSPETKRRVPAPTRPAPRTKKLIPETKRRVPGTKRPIPGKKRSVPGTKRPISGTKRPVPGTKRPAPREPEPPVRKRVKRPAPRRDAYGRFAPKRRRDEQGRFAPETYGRIRKPRRDERGRFAPPPPPKRKRPAPKPVRRRRPERPLVAERSRRAEELVQERLLELQRLLALLEPGLAMDVQSFVNKDGTVDGELRVGELPGEWRESTGVNLLAATLSSAVRDWRPFGARPEMGGSFWVSFGVRFGPRSQAEALAMEEFYRRYKRHRGLPQVGTYPTPAWSTGALQLALVGDTTGMRAMIRHFVDKRGLAPATILVRIIWTPDGSRPGHYRGEK